MAELTGWLAGMPLVNFVLLAGTGLDHFCECSNLHQDFVNMRCVFTLYSRLSHSLIYCQWILLILL